MLCRTSQLRFSLAWTCYVSTGWSSTATTIVFTVTFRNDEKSEHEHGHTSTSEDVLLKLLNLPECTQTWTRFDKRAKTCRTTSSSGTLWENLVARITIDDETGHIMSLKYTTHMTEKDLHRNLPSVRDIRTVLLHFSPVTPNQQLKQS